MIKLNDNNIEFIGEDKNIFKIGDELAIVYKQINNKIYPYIGLNKELNDEKGYKLTKSYTLLFKGDNNKFLSNFGNEFNLKQLSTNIYELIPINKQNNLSISDIKEYIKEFNIEDEVLDVDTFEINFINNI
jgi:hypothetical protein